VRECRNGDACFFAHVPSCKRSFDQIKAVALNFADRYPHNKNAIKIHQFLEQRALKKAAILTPVRTAPVEVNVATSPPVITTVKKPRNCVDVAAGSLAHGPKDESVPACDHVSNGLVAVLRKYGPAVHMCVFVCLLGLLCMN